MAALLVVLSLGLIVPHYKSSDWDNLVEELEAMAGIERRELLRRLTTLFEHLLKLAYQPNEVPRGATAGVEQSPAAAWKSNGYSLKAQT